MFEASFNASLDRYRQLLRQTSSGLPTLSNDNFDTVGVTAPGKYHLNDDAVTKLLEELSKNNFKDASPELRADLLEYFADPDTPFTLKRKKKAWARVEMNLDQLKTAAPPAASSSSLPDDGDLDANE
jgi:hypothetical protein